MPGSTPTTTATGRPVPPRGARCPRCETPVEGDYKFCPTCAFRLRAPEDDPLPPAPPTSSRWRSGFVGVSILAVVLAAAVGTLLFHPEWIRSAERPAPVKAPVTSSARRFTVEDLRGWLVELDSNRVAFRVSLDSVSSLTDAERATVAAQLQGEPYLDAKVYYALQVAAYETTCGQYAEFLHDLEAYPEHIPAIWWPDGHAGRPGDEPSILAHVPDAWILRDPNGTPIDWSLPEADANLPVTQVSYIDALGFCEWAEARLGIDLDLPYEMEWVRAARAGFLDHTWPWGDSEQKYIYACNNLAWGSTRPLAVDYPYSEPTREIAGGTPEGLYAMAGNVREWAREHDFTLTPSLLPGSEPPSLTWLQRPSSEWGVAMGGSFRSGIDDCQVDSRVQLPKRMKREELARLSDLGFRVVSRPR